MASIDLGSLCLPEDVLRLAVDVERVCVDSPERRPETPVFTVKGQSLLVHPTSALTDAHRAGLKKWKRHVIALVGFCQKNNHVFRTTEGMVHTEQAEESIT